MCHFFLMVYFSDIIVIVSNSFMMKAVAATSALQPCMRSLIQQPQCSTKIQEPTKVKNKKKKENILNR